MNTLTAGSAVHDHKLFLTIGFFVLLFYNICPSRGHAKSSPYVVWVVNPNLLQQISLPGDRAGKNFTLLKILRCPGGSNFSSKDSRRPNSLWESVLQ